MRDPLGQLRLRFAGLRLLRDDPVAQVYAGRDFSGYDITLAVLVDSAATRHAFAEAVRRQTAAVGSATVQSDLRAEQPWVAARHPDGAAVVDHVLAELVGSGSPGTTPPPATALTEPATFAPLPVEPPSPVWPDPTLAPINPVPPPPPSPPPSPRARPPAPTRPPATRPPPRPAPAPPGPGRPAPTRPASVAGQRLTPMAVVTMVVVGTIVLMMCCGSWVASAL